MLGKDGCEYSLSLISNPPLFICTAPSDLHPYYRYLTNEENKSVMERLHKWFTWENYKNILNEIKIKND